MILFPLKIMKSLRLKRQVVFCCKLSNSATTQSKKHQNIIKMQKIYMIVYDLDTDVHLELKTTFLSKYNSVFKLDRFFLV